MNHNSPPGLRRWPLWLLAVAAATVFAVWAFSPRPMAVDVAVVTRGRFEQLIQEDGQLRLKNRYTITAPMQAELLRPTLRVGDAVQAGQVIAMLAPVSPPMMDARSRLVLQQRVGRDDAARQAAAAQLGRLTTALGQAILDTQRATQLANDQFLSAAARDQAVLTQHAAEQALEAGSAQLRAANFALAESQAALASMVSNSGSAAWIRIPSPVKGHVLKLYQYSAGPVNTGQPLLDIGDLTAMEAVIDVLSSDARLIQQNAQVRLSLGADTWDVSGRVSRIEPAAFTKISALGIEEQRVNVVVDLDPNQTLKVGDGFRVDSRIELFSTDHALLVPTAALVRDGDHWRAMVLENGRARSRQVELKDRNADTAWVQDIPTSLQPGDRVILYPGHLQSGQAVKASRASAPRQP